MYFFLAVRAHRHLSFTSITDIMISIELPEPQGKTLQEKKIIAMYYLPCEFMSTLSTEKQISIYATL